MFEGFNAHFTSPYSTVMSGDNFNPKLITMQQTNNVHPVSNLLAL
jgi:hypothetical protein